MYSTWTDNYIHSRIFSSSPSLAPFLYLTSFPTSLCLPPFPFDSNLEWILYEPRQTRGRREISGPLLEREATSISIFIKKFKSSHSTPVGERDERGGVRDGTRAGHQ
jgi:hypothetical protein